MRNLHNTITRLKAMRRLAISEDLRDDRLAIFSGFGSNPGALKARTYVPESLRAGAPLVVVLHGCTQTPDGYNRSAAWSDAAEEYGFVLLFPEQQRANNPNLCFNWFQPEDTRRGAGEALSIREMIEHVVVSHGMDQGRIFITGLSAGGAMAQVMLATYPELFHSGAIIGGLPYGVANSVDEAFQRMHGRNAPSTTQLRSALLTAAPGAKTWPRISVWHGTHDQTVKPINATQIVDQWSGVHGSGDTPNQVESGESYTRKAWLNRDGSPALELYLVTGMGHGVPLSAGAKIPLGSSGPFMLEAGISSTARIARTWGLATDQDVADAEGPIARSGSRPAAEGVEALVTRAMTYARRPEGGKPDGSQGVEKVITDALRAAGLMR